ncbi:MAG: hypothetical protein KF802_05580 [Bdellovibrionaceae bacterium]|nr:hypothetical protein [Pseudobdellovibrionaceae bacterium]MBX3032394.1 hypothetical protein [Pseudobdellovibrionaceae bacterium]
MAMDELLIEFQSESKNLVSQLLGILDHIEGDYSQYRRLEEFGQIIDRIMGAAKTLKQNGIDPQALDKIGAYAEVCKMVSYKASQVGNNAQLYTIVVALLMDATEMFEEMLNRIGERAGADVKTILSETFLDRLRWVSRQFDEGLRGSIGADNGSRNLAQEQLDDLLKKLGL